MGTLWARSGSMEFTNSGSLAIGAKAYFYEAGTTTPKPVYREGAESTAYTQPVTADGNGRWPAVFVPFGSYKVVVTTSAGAAIGSDIDYIPNDAPTDPTDTVDENSLLRTGQIVFEFKTGTSDGFVRCNGRTIGSATSGGTERANADCEDLFLYLWNNFGNSILAVGGGRGATAAADWSANKAIALPDMRCAVPAGLSGMGNSVSSNFGSVPVVTGSGDTGGSTLGENTHQLTQTEIPVHNHPISFTSGAGSSHSHALTAASAASGGAHTHALSAIATTSDGAHDHGGATGGQSQTHTHTGAVGAVGTTTFQAGATTGVNSVGTQNTGNASVDHTHTISSGGAHTHTVSGTADSNGAHTHTLSGSSDAEASHTHLVSGNTSNTGSGGVHNNFSLAMVGTYYIKL